MNIQRTCYLIAASPRSGSQLLEVLLTSTGLAGFPGEHFNPWHMGDAARSFTDDLLYGLEQIQKLIEKHTSPNGVSSSLPDAHAAAAQASRFPVRSLGGKI